MTDRETFFYENAGWSYDPKAETSDQGRRRCARSLAEAEAWAERVGLEAEWSEDYEGGDIFGDEAHGGPYYQAWVRDSEGWCVASLGGIDSDPCPTGGGRLTPYARVIEAELFAEARFTMLNGPSVEAVR